MDKGYLATYLRISDDDEDLGEAKRESNSILNQRSVLEHYISSHDELSQYPVKEFVDDADIIGLNQKTFDLRGFTD